MNRRISLIFAGFILMFAIVTFRVIYILADSPSDIAKETSRTSIEKRSFHPVVQEFLDHQYKKQLGPKQNGKFLKRAEIEDRNGHTLAYSLLRYNIYFDGRKDISINQTSINKIAELLGIESQKISDAMEQERVVLLKRNTTKAIANKIYELRLSSLLTEKVLARKYPEGNLLSHAIGFMGFNGDGLTGIEKTYDEILKISKNETWQSGDIRLRLTVDRDLQFSVEQRLKKARTKHQAKYALALIQDIHTGEILSMAAEPSFDLNNFNKVDEQLFFNPTISELIEPGSVFKAFFLAQILKNLDEQEIKNRLERKSYFCEGYYMTENGEHIQCTGVHGAVSLLDIIRYSCNAGMMLAMEDFSSSDMRDFLANLHVGDKVNIDLPGESKGILPTLDQWGQRTKATITIGQGVALTPLQLINSFSQLINGGKSLQPYLVKEIQYYKGGEMMDRLSPKKTKESGIPSQLISKMVVKALVEGTVAGSTGRQSRKTGLMSVFGKTGTSQQVNLENGGYFTDRYNSLFVGGYPSESPKYAILVALIDPKIEHQSGLSSAPLFAEVADDLIRALPAYDERLVIKMHSETKTGNNFQLEDTVNELEKKEKHVSSLAEGLAINNFERMPDFTDLSLKQSLWLLNKLKIGREKRNLDLISELLGTGFVIRQTPLPGEKIDEEEKVFLYLNP